MRIRSRADRRGRDSTQRSRARRPTSLLAAVALVGGLLLPGQTAADEFRPLAIVFDVMVLRPIGLAATAVGFGFFYPAAVLSIAGGRDTRKEAWEHFVTTPSRDTIERRLGEF